jgi:hypothetical protein
MRESSNLGFPNWYLREASYDGTTGIHRRTSYSNPHWRRNCVYDGITSKCERELQETCCLSDSVRLDGPVLVVIGAPEVTDVNAGAGHCESFKANKCRRRVEIARRV